jgi:hypothetical protein
MTRTTTLPIVLAVTLLASCSSTVDPGEVGTGTYTWSQRELRGEFSGSLLDVASAAERAFNALRLVGVDPVVDGLKGKITATTADGSPVRVKLKAVDFERTRFKIKVGTFGNKAMSQQVARYVARELEAGTRGASTSGP